MPLDWIPQTGEHDGKEEVMSSEMPAIPELELMNQPLPDSPSQGEENPAAR